MYKLSDAEFDIMEILWNQLQPIQPAVLLKLIYDKHNWNISTLNTLLSRLEEKDFVKITYEKRFRYVSYKISKEDYGRHEAKNIMKRLFGNSAKNMFAALINTDELTEEQYNELESMLNKHKEK